MIQEKDFLYRVPVKNVLVTTPRQQIRNPEILVDLEGGEFMHGNILDANSTNKLINQSVKDAVDNKLIESGYVTKDLLEAETTRATEQENSLKTLIDAETSARTNGDEGLSAKIQAEQTRAEGKEKEISDKLTIVDGDSNTEGSFRKAIADVIAAAPEDLDTLKEIADKLAGNDDLHTALNQAITEKADASALANEVSRATGVESNLQAAIDTKQPKGNYLTEHQDLSGYAKKTEIPTNVSSLTNDSNFITIDDVDFTPYAKAVDLTNEISRAKGEESTIKETLNTKYDARTIPVASKEQFGIAKIGDGLNVAAGVISIAPDYLVDMMSYGVEWDVTVADPTCTRIGNPLFHKSLPIQSEYKGCVVKNGKLYYYLNPNDWSKTSNGSNSNLDGTDGDVMIHTPKFYGKSGSNGNKRWVRISTVKVDASWVEIPEMFISAYHNTIYTDGDTTKIASVVSTDAKYRGGGRRSGYDKYLSTDQFKTDLGKPVANISRATMRTYAAATGQELLCYEFYKWILYWNYVIEYANFNSQKEFNSELTSDGYHQGGLGPGLTTWDWSSWSTYNGNYAITPCGYTNKFGNFSGVKAIQIQSPEKTLYANRWRGFENPFGSICTNLEGIVIKRDAAKANSNVYTTTDVLKYGDDYSLFDIAGVEIAQDGWIGTFDLGSKAEIIPSSISGSQSTYKCDYHWCDVNSVENRILLMGGYAARGSGAGLGCFFSTNGVGVAHANVGFRSLVRV